MNANLLSQYGLVDLKTIDPSIQIDLKYATTDNFTNQIVYPSQDCFLLLEVALNLKKAQEELKIFNKGLKVWDAFRPVSAQWKFWEIMPDERYVCDPRKGSRHSRGAAVDVTLIDHLGGELPMPTRFDDFSERAHIDYKNCSEEEIRNRDFLRQIMEKNGFNGISTEWWHFDLRGFENYPLIEF